MIERSRIAELLRGSIPQTNEEKEWIEDWHKVSEQSQKKSEEFEKKYKQYEEEQEQLLRKYAPKEYWSDGFYNSEEFKKIEKEVLNRVNDEICSNPKGFHDEYHRRTYGRRRRQQIIRKEYGYKWYDMYNLMPQEYWDEYYVIRKKYGFRL